MKKTNISFSNLNPNQEYQLKLNITEFLLTTQEISSKEADKRDAQALEEKNKKSKENCNSR